MRRQKSKRIEFSSFLVVYRRQMWARFFPVWKDHVKKKLIPKYSDYLNNHTLSCRMSVCTYVCAYVFSLVCVRLISRTRGGSRTGTTTSVGSHSGGRGASARRASTAAPGARAWTTRSATSSRTATA